jgi:hypothetical protein
VIRHGARASGWIACRRSTKHLARGLVLLKDTIAVTPTNKTWTDHTRDQYMPGAPCRYRLPIKSFTIAPATLIGSVSRNRPTTMAR